MLLKAASSVTKFCVWYELLSCATLFWESRAFAFKLNLQQRLPKAAWTIIIDTASKLRCPLGNLLLLQLSGTCLSWRFDKEGIHLASPLSDRCEVLNALQFNWTFLRQLTFVGVPALAT